MDDAGFVSVVQGFGDGRAEFDGFADGQRVRVDPLVEAGAVDEFAGDVDAAVLTPDLVDGDDVPMPHLRGGSHFTQELLGVGFGEIFLARHLESDNAVELCVSRFPDGSKRTLSQAAEQLKLSQHSSGIEESSRLDILGQIETASARRARDVARRIVVDHFDRIVAVRTTNLHGVGWALLSVCFVCSRSREPQDGQECPSYFTTKLTCSIAAWPDLRNGRGIGWACPFSSIVRERNVYSPAGSPGSNAAQ